MWREDGCKYWDFCIQTLCWGYPRFLVTRSLVLFVYFVDRCLSFFLLRFTDSDYLFDIFKLFLFLQKLTKRFRVFIICWNNRNKGIKVKQEVLREKKTTNERYLKCIEIENNIPDCLAIICKLNGYCYDKKNHFNS